MTAAAGSTLAPGGARPAGPDPGGVPPGSSTPAQSDDSLRLYDATLGKFITGAKQRWRDDQPVPRVQPSPLSPSPTDTGAVNYTDIIAAFNRQVRRTGQAIERCHRNLIKQDPRYETETIRLRIDLDLLPTGNAANLRYSPATNQRFEACMSTVAALWHVGPHTAGTLPLQYPITLVPVGGKRPRRFQTDSAVASRSDTAFSVATSADDAPGTAAGTAGGSSTTAAASSQGGAAGSDNSHDLGMLEETAAAFEQYVEPVPTQSVIDRIMRGLNVLVARSEGRIQRCYVSLLKNDARLWNDPVQLQMTLIVRPNGTVTNQTLSPDLGKAFNTCLSTIVASWSVGAFDGSSVLLRYPLKLVPKR